jgi:hypothetical protein
LGVAADRRQRLDGRILKRCIKKIISTRVQGCQMAFFVERSSTIECSTHPSPPPNLETNAKNYHSARIAERKMRFRWTFFLQIYIQFYSACMHNFYLFTLSQFYNFQASLNHFVSCRANIGRRIGEIGLGVRVKMATVMPSTYTYERDVNRLLQKMR